MPEKSGPHSDDSRPDRAGVDHPEECDGSGPGGQGEAQTEPPGPARPMKLIPSQPDARTPRQAAPGPAGPPRLLDRARTSLLRAEWHAVQAGFVDDPRQAVRQADDLVAKSAELIGEAVSARREELSGTGRRPDDAARTEDLRLALQQYRTLLDRMLDI